MKLIIDILLVLNTFVYPPRGVRLMAYDARLMPLVYALGEAGPRFRLRPRCASIARFSNTHHRHHSSG